MVGGGRIHGSPTSSAGSILRRRAHQTLHVGCDDRAIVEEDLGVQIVLVVRERPDHSTQNEIIISITQLRQLKTWRLHVIDLDYHPWILSIECLDDRGKYRCCNRLGRSNLQLSGGRIA